MRRNGVFEFDGDRRRENQPATSTDGFTPDDAGAQRQGRPGLGVLIGLILLLMLEAWLHSDDFLLRYRSVFAAGRAMDKVIFVEQHKPALLIAGNSRIDNGFNPRVLGQELALGEHLIFNLGMPGANAGNIYGVLRRFAKDGVLGEGGIRYLVLGLDETTFQSEDSLGYSVFFNNRGELLRHGSFDTWLATYLRLWGYSGNLKQLREPEKLLRFVAATTRSIDPVGGSAAKYFGYRAGFAGKFQNAEQILLQQTSYSFPPAANQMSYLKLIVKLLGESNVRIAVMCPPLLNRRTLIESGGVTLPNSFAPISDYLRENNIALITFEGVLPRSIDEFVNAGHLNDSGAERYSRILAKKIIAIWPELE